MPWMVGIDEAGYGPNLGPLVMTAVTCRLPGNPAETNLWKKLRRAVRRQEEQADRRLLIEDSKIVYTTSRGLHDLERGVLSALPLDFEAGELSLSELLDYVCPSHSCELTPERWYLGRCILPIHVKQKDLSAACKRFRRASEKAKVEWSAPRCVVTCPTTFNSLLDQWGSKGAILGRGLADLLRHVLDTVPPDDSVLVLVDKHGGRNTYAPILQQAITDGFVAVEAEGMELSRYRVLGLAQQVVISFQPRADLTHFCVALASMVSKFIRELLMLEFNAFWNQHMPELKPTAGYPHDAARFFKDIRPVIRRLGIAEETVWRRQ
jgi:ribonuclease HII